MPMELDLTLGSKVERMDRWLENARRKLNASDIALLIELIYSFDIDSLPPCPGHGTAREVIERYLAECECGFASSPISGPRLRRTLNETFGVNLDALSALEGSRISLFSKNQWMLRQETDLFIVHTGAGDIDVRIYPTSYFWMSYPSDALPEDYMHAMLLLGYDYDENSSSHSYCSPSGEAVPDSFKGRTIQTLRQMIARSFSIR